MYLYEDHSKSPLKYAAIKAISCVRRVTTLMPAELLYLLCRLFSPLVFALFTLPSKAMRALGATERLAGRMPFNFGKGVFSLA